MALFVARISRGRTLRELVGVVALVAPLVTCFWFTIVGGTGISWKLPNRALFPSLLKALICPLPC